MTIKRVFGISLLVILAWFAYYTISPLFISIRLDEQAPDMSPGNTLPLATTTSTASTTTQIPATTEPALKSAPIIGTAGHPASGTVRIISANGKQYLRYENFKTINGPDIFVYLANDLEAKDFVSLGRVKATEGNVNYEIPAVVDPSAYRYAMIWCDTFNTLFNHADISALTQ